MDMLGKVRRMKMRDKLTISEISKRTGLARNTVKRWLRAPGDVSPKYLRRSDPTKLSAYEATLVMALKADAHRHKDGRLGCCRFLRRRPKRITLPRTLQD